MNLKLYSWSNQSGEPVDGGLVTCLILTENSDKTPRFLGTGFFIAPQGVIVTARHCLVDSRGNYLPRVQIIQFFENQTYHVRPIWRYYCNDSDLAVLLPNHMINSKTGQMVVNPTVMITSKRQKIGEAILSYTFPNTDIVDGSNQIKISANDMWHTGIIEDFHPNGFSLLKNSCYQSSMQILPGSSGGPVANSEGKIFAINSSGSDVSNEINPYSFLTPIEHCFDIRIDGTKGEKYSIRQLIDLGQIPFEK